MEVYTFDEGDNISKKPVLYTINSNGCMICISHYKSKDGHIQLKRNNKHVTLHRYAYELKHGEIGDRNIVVRHTCDNPDCFNHEHLILGTHEDNVRDRVERNRSAKGTQNGRAKLTEDDVIAIRNNQSMSCRRWAKHFGVDPKTIRKIKKYETWKHVV